MVTVAGPCYDAPISRSRHSCPVQTRLNDSPGATLGAICNKSRLSPELGGGRWKVFCHQPTRPSSFPSLFSSSPRARCDWGPGRATLQPPGWLLASDLSDILSRLATACQRSTATAHQQATERIWRTCWVIIICNSVKLVSQRQVSSEQVSVARR